MPPRLLVAAFLALPAAAAPVPTGAAAVKAVFLFNFAKFVEWPPESFTSPEAPIVIGVLGADPFGGALDQAVSSETVRGRRVEIKRFRALDDMTACHILFISPSHAARVNDILKRLGRTGTLTVADAEGFAARGGTIQFRDEGGRLRFEISREAAERSGLKVSARLLNLASAVYPRRP